LDQAEAIGAEAEQPFYVRPQHAGALLEAASSIRQREVELHQNTLQNAYGDNVGQYDRSVPLNNEPSLFKLGESPQLDPSQKVNINNYIKLQKGETVDNKDIIREKASILDVDASILVGESLSKDNSEANMQLGPIVNATRNETMM
jgi:hypothetical protein